MCFMIFIFFYLFSFPSSFLSPSLYLFSREQKSHECKESKIEIPEDFIQMEDKLKKEELNNLSLALDEVKDIVHHNVDSLQSVWLLITLC